MTRRRKKRDGPKILTSRKVRELSTGFLIWVGSGSTCSGHGTVTSVVDIQCPGQLHLTARTFQGHPCLNQGLLRSPKNDHLLGLRCKLASTKGNFKNATDHRTSILK